MSASRENLAVCTPAEVAAKLAEFGLEHWQHENGWIHRTYKTENWPTALAIVNTIGFVAEAAWHHPDITISGRKVIVKLKTHFKNGITERDFALARRIEDLILWQPLPEGPFELNPNKWVSG